MVLPRGRGVYDDSDESNNFTLHPWDAFKFRESQEVWQASDFLALPLSFNVEQSSLGHHSQGGWQASAFLTVPPSLNVGQSSLGHGRWGYEAINAGDTPRAVVTPETGVYTLAAAAWPPYLRQHIYHRQAAPQSPEPPPTVTSESERVSLPQQADGRYQRSVTSMPGHYREAAGDPNTFPLHPLATPRALPAFETSQLDPPFNTPLDHESLSLTPPRSPQPSMRPVGRKLVPPHLNRAQKSVRSDPYIRECYDRRTLELSPGINSPTARWAVEPSDTQAPSGTSATHGSRIDLLRQ
ncbi:hypothetical protein FA13DRAFT_315174 [Coprinellus micaceus]|uniref:Uncharacterized protein n=1 Tax=Coprinellus micaceus TaxID=71717 RepID=A0A4Y7TDA7_COPMI|nr:hypothetical protein FA13DRAFT_315174 [Coprinellus micaceus]